MSAQSGCRRPSGGGGGGEACPPLAVDDEGSDVQKVRPRPAILGPHPPFPLGGGRSPSLGIKCSGKTPSGPLAAADSAAGEGGSTAGAGRGGEGSEPGVHAVPRVCRRGHGAESRVDRRGPGEGGGGRGGRRYAAGCYHGLKVLLVLADVGFACIWGGWHAPCVRRRRSLSRNG